MLTRPIRRAFDLHEMTPEEEEEEEIAVDCIPIRRRLIGFVNETRRAGGGGGRVGGVGVGVGGRFLAPPQCRPFYDRPW